MQIYKFNLFIKTKSHKINFLKNSNKSFGKPLELSLVLKVLKEKIIGSIDHSILYVKISDFP